MTTFNAAQTKLINALRERYPEQKQFKRSMIVQVNEDLGNKPGTAAGVMRKLERGTAHGHYLMVGASVVPIQETIEVDMNTGEERKVESVVNDEVFVPEKVDAFVKWGHFDDLERIVASKMFYPVFLTGLSGNGKTMMAEQVCAELGREYVRVQITPETDEDDLIGGFRLLDGETVFAKGPVIKAMEAGAVLLIDEIDRSSNKIMSLQGVLEGKPVLIKKTGEVVRPAHGFTVIATGNTKGQGSEDGRFISAGIIDEALLERFTIAMEQPYPSENIEFKIVTNHMALYGEVDKQFAKVLTKWGVAIRKTYEEDGVDELVSTRRLCHIVQTYSIFKDRKKAINLCISRFDDDTKEAFMDLYEKMDVPPVEEVKYDAPKKKQVDPLRPGDFNPF